MNNDYIRREDVVDALKAQADTMRTWVERYAEQRRGILTAVNIVEDIKPADVVPVIRCRDCIHHHYESTDIPYCDRIDYGYGWKDNDFCSRGERREE